MTTRLILVVFLTSLIPGVPGQHGATMFCKTCHSVHDPAHCHVIEACREGYCALEVYQLNGARTYTYSCKEHHSCEHHLIGKRGPPGPQHDGGILECKQCCQFTGCEKYLCHISTLGSVDVTVNMGTAFTLGVDSSSSGPCVDVEDTHFRCSDWKALGFCAPDTVPGYQVSLEQCRKTCDLCGVK